jgi:DNA-binding MarR family transcriptional regulator
MGYYYLFRRINGMQESKLAILNDPVINLIALLDQTNDIIYRAEELEISKFNVSLAQVKVMYIITKSASDNGVSLADLSKLMLREPNSVTTLIQRMEKAGLVKKKRVKKENKTFVSITEKGNDLIFNKITQESMYAIASSLTEVEIQNLRMYLNKLREKGRQVLGLDLKPPILR